MEAQEQQGGTPQPQQVHKDLKVMNHFIYQISLPKTVSIFTYVPKHISESKKKNKLKNKFDSFNYYQNNQSKAITKILFLTDFNFIDQGQHPFTEPSGKIRLFSELNGKRLKVTEAAYIGHVNDELIVKKMDGVKLGENGEEVQTIDDKFQLIKIGNPQRFNQFLKLMSLNKNAINLSIRVIIDETDPKLSQVIDYEFFFRQKALIKKHDPKAN